MTRQVLFADLLARQAIPCPFSDGAEVKLVLWHLVHGLCCFLSFPTWHGVASMAKVLLYGSLERSEPALPRKR